MSILVTATVITTSLVAECWMDFAEHCYVFTGFHLQANEVRERTLLRIPLRQKKSQMERYFAPAVRPRPPRRNLRSRLHHLLHNIAEVVASEIGPGRLQSALRGHFAFASNRRTCC